MRYAVFLIIISFLASAGYCQKSFEEFTQLDAKKQSKYIDLWQVFKIDKYGRGIFPDLSKKEIKKVALVAYTMYAPESWDKYGGAIYRNSLTEVGIHYFADQLYDHSINEIKASFDSYGIELITRENMNDAQKAVLSEVEGGTWLKGKEKDGYYKFTNKAIKVGTAIDGYKNWMLSFDLPWPWSNIVLAKVANAMDVDAVLLVNQRLDLTKDFGYAACLMTMVGENPIPKIEGKKYPGLSYVDGMYYGQAALTFYKPIIFAVSKKKEIISENYNQFGEVNKVLTDALLEDIRERQSTNQK
jgi:hypothetical protein